MDNNIDWKITHGREGSTLDFKREQYIKEKYISLIKDIMSMANTPIEGNRYIIIGVKENSDGIKKIHPIESKDFTDAATYQQIIRNNIEPTIEFDYFPYDTEEGKLGIIEITGYNDPPYMMKKDYNSTKRGEGLKKGDCFVRIGSQQEKMTRQDLDEIMSAKKKNQFDNNIFFGFNDNFDKTLDIVKPKQNMLPSEKRKILLKEELKELIKIDEQKEIEERGNQIKSGSQNLSFKLNLPDFTSFNEIMGIPPQRTQESIKKNIENVKSDYSKNDYYYFEEILSNKLNFYIYNNTETHLEDFQITIKIPKSIGFLSEKLPTPPEETYRDPYHSLLVHDIPVLSDNGYPFIDVDTSETEYIIQQNFSSLRHKQSTRLFDENLRLFIYPKSIGNEFCILYELHAKNLPQPIVQNLYIKVVG